MVGVESKGIGGRQNKGGGGSTEKGGMKKKEGGCNVRVKRRIGWEMKWGWGIMLWGWDVEERV